MLRRFPTYTCPPMPQELFSTCTHVSLHCSLTEGTRGLVDEPMLNRMPSVGADGAACGAHLINMSRGGVVLESAVAAALDAGILDSYCADVYVSGADRTRRPRGPVFCGPSMSATPHVRRLKNRCRARARFSDTTASVALRTLAARRSRLRHALVLRL